MIAFSQITQHWAASGVLIFHQLPRILNSWVYKTEQKQTDLDWIKWSQAEGASLRLELRSATTPRRVNRDSIVCHLLSEESHQPAHLQRRTDGQAFKCFLRGFTIFCLGALKLIWRIISNKIYKSLRTQALVASLTAKSFSLAALRTFWTTFPDQF